MSRPNGTAGSKLLTAGIVLFLVSWLVPVYEGQRPLGLLVSNSVTSGPDWLPGWGAFRFAWDNLWGDPPDADEAWRARVLGSTCLTNLVMLGALLAFARKKHRAVPGLLLLGCAGLDASWLYLCELEQVKSLRPGYYLWLASFWLTGLGALLQPTPAPKG